MWHEARRQERKIRGMLVDYRKRAERRRDFYEKIKADPTQFLQVHGRQCKVHLDPAIAAAADSAVMMPWQGNSNNLIDRFDVRAHLDLIPPVKKEEDPDVSQEERHLNYERYRIIAQNGYLGISEEKFLKQLHLEEQFGYTETKIKKEPKGSGAAIGFNYEEGTAISAPTESPEENFEDENSDSDLDVDLAINVSKIDSAQAHEMNKHGQQFGMSGNDFYSFLTDDMEEAESYKLAKEEEHEKALFSGRKSRRERRAHREKRLANRKISPPSYAAKESPTNPSLRDDSKSPSRSPSPDAGKITYITSFGDDEETPSSSKPTYADKVKYGKSKKRGNSSDRLVYFGRKSRSSSREVSYSKRKRSSSRSKRSRSRSKSRRSRSRNRRSRTRSRSRKVVHSYSKEKSRSRSPLFRNRKSKSRSRSRSVKVRKSLSISTSRSRSRSQRSRSRSRSRVERSKSRSQSGSISRNRRSRSRSRQRVKSFRRRSVSSSSLSSSTCSSKTESKAKSPSPSLNRSKTKSKSRSVEAPSPPRIIPRYYGRKRSDESSSESSSTDNEGNQDAEMTPAFPVSSDSKYRSGNNSGTVSKKPSTALTVIERLKLKRQALINRQFKKDKIAEVQKLEREKQEQQTREDELREMAIKLRRRQREKRHAYDRTSSSDSEKSNASLKKEKSISPRSKDRDSNRSDRDRREKDRRSRSRDRNRRDDRRGRSRGKDRSRSRSRRQYERGRDERDNKRGRSPENKETTRKLVDY